jgi:hypothetical protein
MARIRTIKPELWTSEDFCRLSAVGSLTFLALIGHADDEGRVKTTPQHVAKQMLHGSASSNAVARQLQRMQQLGMIQTYTTNGGDFIALSNWHLHQRVDHPSKSNYPEPGQQSLLPVENPPFANPRELSPSSRARTGPDRKGPDRKGPEGTVRTGPRANKKAPERITATELLAVAQQGQRPQ